jgi:hypothetical protein
LPLPLLSSLTLTSLPKPNDTDIEKIPDSARQFDIILIFFALTASTREEEFVAGANTVSWMRPATNFE